MAVDVESVLVSVGASMVGTVLVLALHWLFVLRGGLTYDKVAPGQLQIRKAASGVSAKPLSSLKSMGRSSLGGEDSNRNRRGSWRGRRKSRNSASFRQPQITFGEMHGSEVGDFLPDDEDDPGMSAQTTRAIATSGVEMPSLVLMTDFGGVENDRGDHVALFLMRGLEELRVAVPSAVIVSGKGDANRIEQVSLTVDKLGLGRGLGHAATLVGAGKDVQTPSAPPQGVRVLSAMETFSEVLLDESTPPKSVIIACLCASTDFAAFLRQHGEEAAPKILHVTRASTCVPCPLPVPLPPPL